MITTYKMIAANGIVRAIWTKLGMLLGRLGVKGPIYDEWDFDEMASVRARLKRSRDFPECVVAWRAPMTAVEMALYSRSRDFDRQSFS